MREAKMFAGIGIFIGAAIAAVAVISIAAQADPKQAKVCDSYSWCTDWTKNPFSGTRTGKGGK